MGRWTQRAHELEAQSGDRSEDITDTPYIIEITSPAQTPSELSQMRYEDETDVTSAGPEAPVYLTAADDADVMWRVAVMRPQVPPWGPIRCLLARLDTPATDAPRCCGSCGDPLPEGCQFRCAPCIRAIEIVLNSVREGVK